MRVKHRLASGVRHASVGFGRSLLDLLTVLGRLFLSIHQSLFSLVDLFFGVSAVALLINSLRRQQAPRLRQQLLAISVGLVSCLVLYAFATTIPTLFGRPLDRSMQAALTTAALTLGLISSACERFSAELHLVRRLSPAWTC